MNEQNDLRERLATLAHESWSGWMSYLFARCSRGPAGTVLIPAALAERWTRQASTPYAALPESEKESDRAEADKMIERLLDYLDDLDAEKDAQNPEFIAALRAALADDTHIPIEP